MSLRKNIADSRFYNGLVERLVAGWVRWAHRSSDWQHVGFQPMYDEVSQGRPVIVVLWHQRLMMAPYLFDVDKGPICSLTSSGRAGRMAGQVQKRFGFGTVAMPSQSRNLALTRQVLGKIKQGVSVGIAADGPRGPARQAQMVPVSWARASGTRVFLVTFSARKVWELATWDRMWVPRPFTSGVFLCREWTKEVPRKADPATMEALRLDMQSDLDAICAEADQLAQRQSGVLKT